jgi:hypothetical protein
MADTYPRQTVLLVSLLYLTELSSPNMSGIENLSEKLLSVMMNTY